MVVQEWCGGVGAGGSHTSLFAVIFCVSLALLYVVTVSYVVAAILSTGPHLVGVGEGTGLMASFWAHP